ncbi:MAG: heme A synthase [Candidatus Omnitrophica bacterium]|nr:heme A synthase [Candidatus Omnitrophota bacterium]
MTSGGLDKPARLSGFSSMCLRRFSKAICFSTLFLIFAGGMVTSTGSGLSVPDWPLSYGMLFPPMVGGIFYEHGHRMVAATVGFLTLCLTIWLGVREKRKWVRRLGIGALTAVVLQGILGGLTVLFLLPTPISVLHAVLAQTFFVLTILIAYSLSVERQRRSDQAPEHHPALVKVTLVFAGLVYVQLILGALMRHTESGLAIPDFPTMGGYWLPPFNEAMLRHINYWRFEYNLDAVTISQVIIHFIHRTGALVVAFAAGIINYAGWRTGVQERTLVRTILFLNIAVVLQLCLGILTVLTGKAPHITSVHVVTGAATLGVSILLLLRASPLSWAEFVKSVRES